MSEDPVATFDCRVVGCAGTARSSRGMYAYLCDEHAALKRAAVPAKSPAPAPRSPAGEAGSYFDRVQRLTKAARRVDICKGKYARAKAELKEALADYSTAVADLEVRREDLAA